MRKICRKTSLQLLHFCILKYFSCVKAIHKVGFIPEYLVNKLIFLLYSEVIPIFLCFNFRHNIFVSDCIEKQKKQIMLENWGGRCVIPSPSSGKTGELILWQVCSFSVHTNNSIYYNWKYTYLLCQTSTVSTFEFMELLEKPHLLMFYFWGRSSFVYHFFVCLCVSMYWKIVCDCKNEKR